MEVIDSGPWKFELGLKTFVNADGSVDGELRIGNLPDVWRVLDGIPKLAEFLSRVLRQVGTLIPKAEGGAYWISLGVRFGPQNETEMEGLAELYKRHRGLFQVAAHPTNAAYLSGIMNNVVGVEDIIKRLLDKRSLPPTVVFIRVTWTPDGSRPERYEGEKGGG